MEILFNYRPAGQVLTTTNGDVILLAIRKGPKGILSNIVGMGPIVIWDVADMDAHLGDSEETLKQRTIDVLNS